MIARKLQETLSQPDERLEILPWWVSRRTLERVNEVRAQIAGTVYTLSEEGRALGPSLRRLGFAGIARSSGAEES